MINKELKDNINNLLRHHIPFAVVREPGKDPKIILHDSSDRFTITTWNGHSFSIDQSNQGNSKATVPSQTPDIIHLSQVEAIVERIKSRGGGKTVLSRIVSSESKQCDWADICEKLWSNFPTAFGYIFYTPETGAWLGATPEILLHVNKDGEFITHALAGTLNVNQEWDEKNIEEHQIVVDYIENILKNDGILYSILKRQDLLYGKIKHLCTAFKGKLPYKEYDIESLLKKLAPTPALAGYPKEAALEDINSIEMHNRGCYGGYMTLENKEGHFSYVTIRCMQFDPSSGKIAVYAGGGITQASEPETESCETYMKADALLRLIN